MAKCVISRFIEGVTLNPKEYVFDNDNHIMIFDDYDSAKNYILAHGYTEEDIDNGIYIDDAAEEGWNYLIRNPINN